MGFFDRFKDKKPAAAPAAGSIPAPAPAAEPARPTTAGGTIPRLAEARRKLDARDLPGAMAIYEEVLAAAGSRPDVLVTISGDLGVHGHVVQLIELIAPRYDAEKHGPATGMNLLQAYLVAREPEAAQHLLDILFGLQRPELEDRLLGFSNALAELMAGHAAAAEQVAGPAGGTKVNIVTISKPVWAYGLEDAAPQLFPAKEGRLRRVIFSQLAVPGLEKADEIQRQPENELGRFTRGFPLWLAETFAASAGYQPNAALGVMEAGHYLMLPVDWTAENVRQFGETSEGQLDFAVTGSLRDRHGDFELVLRVWEIRKFREIKAFTTRWTPSTADAVLSQFHEQLRTYMEWTPLPAGTGLAYAAPASPTTYLQALGGSLSLFLGEKGVLPPEHVNVTADIFLRSARANPADTRAQLALITALLRLKERGVPFDEAARRHACDWLATPAAHAADVAALVVKLA